MLKYSVIPKPVRYDTREASVEISVNTAVLCSEEFVSVGDFLTSYLKTEKNASGNAIRIKKVNGIAEEGYALYSENGDIYIKASTEKGAYYGAVTLKWIILQSEKKGGTAKVSGFFIEDKPEYSHRGFMLDESRHFFGVSTVKNLLDNMSMLKMNVFHWHLADDHGYRIESKVFPLLNEIGSVRSSSGLGRYEDNNTYGPFYYTFEQINEIVEYARERHISVIPEIDMPGHCSEFLASYPFLSSSDEEVKVAVRNGVIPNLLNVCDDRLYDFLSKLFDEVCPLFPDNRFHIGSDEAVYTFWETNEDVQTFMKENGIENEKQLQIYFINRVSEMLSQRGKRCVAWSDCIEGDIDDNVICQLWRKRDMAHIMPQENREIIASLTNYFYFDYSHTALPINAVYSFNEKALKLDKRNKKINGVECALWTEFIDTDEALECGVYPRIAAVAEVGWTKLDKRNVYDFKRRLKFYILFFRNRKINYYRVKNNPFSFWLGNIYSMGKDGKDYRKNEKAKEKEKEKEN